MFNGELSSARRKYEAITSNVLRSDVIEELSRDLLATNIFTSGA
jgi:hypothetical protein